MLGLNDHFLPRHPPADFGKGRLGHELGNGQYVLGRRPDIIIFNVGSRPAFRPGRELRSDPMFQAHYAPVRLMVPGLRRSRLVFVSKYSDKIGIRQNADSISIPGYLFTGGEVVAKPDASGQLVAELRDGASARFQFDHSSGVIGSVSLKPATSAATIALVEEVGPGVIVEVRATSKQPVILEEVVLVREPALTTVNP
jgi:hypothetical protein